MATTRRGNETRYTKGNSSRSGVRSRKRKNVRTKKYSGCTVRPNYTIKTGPEAGHVVNHDVFSIWMKHRGETLISGVGVPHKEGYIVKSRSGNEWHKYCFTITQGVNKQVTTGFVNPRTKTVHLPYLGVGYIASPTGGKSKGGYCFHPTGKK